MGTKRQIKFVAIVRLWRDKVNGNTYHSVRVIRTRDGKILYCPFTYGYGDHYRVTALNAMAEAKWLPTKYRQPNCNGTPNVWLYERDNNYPILWAVSEGTKRDCVANGKE
jgi:hypothetical protein